MNKTNWNIRFMELADHIAQWSKDRSTKIGAVIVKDKNIISTGYNGFPRGCDDDIEERHQRPQKYQWTSHAEENAIISAARHGQPTLDAEMYVNWFPCSKCAGQIINAGIKTIYCDKEPDWSLNDDWTNDFLISIQKLNEGGVKIVYLNYQANRK